MKNHLKEVESQILSLPTPKQAFSPEAYIGGGQSQLKYCNLKVPAVRSTYKKGFSFSKLPASEQIKTWDYIWKESAYFEVKLMALYWAASLKQEELVKYSPILLKWVSLVDNWAHSDEVSGFYSKILETDHKKFFPQFQKWAKSKNPWERRQSLVGLLFYSRFRKKALPFKTLQKMIDQQMHDEHYYVQKGVGWTIREVYNLYPKQTYQYLKKVAHLIPPAGWTAATEKLSAKDKAPLSKLRKARSSN